MPSAMVTFNGRITLPTDVRKRLGLKTGDNVEFVEVGKSRFEICPCPASMGDFESAVPDQAYVPAASETIH